MKKKILSLVLAASLCTGCTLGAYAMSEEELREHQAWDTMQLQACYDSIDALWQQKQELEYEIAVLGENLVNVMVSIDVLQVEIEDKKAEIELTRENLEKGKNAQNELYEAVKERIQYLYENGGDDAWVQALLNAENLADILTKAEYSQAMYEQDKKNLEKLEATVVQVQNLQSRYESELGELEEMEMAYEAQSDELQYLIDEKSWDSYNIDDEIAYARQLAADYEAILYQETMELERMVAERLAIEEAEREAAARAAAEAEAAAAAEAEEQVTYYVDEEGMIYDEAGDMVGQVPTTTEEEFDEDGTVISTTEVPSVSAGYYTASASDSDSYSSGSSVVDFATQFVGNPYVWGGTSLTDGADCSGFVQSVYANFGVDLPRTSYEQQTAGYSVSYADAQPGDLICYGGHVAIYMGDGEIVHASNSVDGIKISEDATYRQILDVRRVI